MELADSGKDQQRALWLRFAPVAGLSVAVLVIALSVQSQLSQLPKTASPELSVAGPGELGEIGDAVEEASRRADGPMSVAAEPEESPAGQFVPVSHQNYLKRAQDAGIIDNGTSIPARKVRLEFEDAWHWHDPETQTNIRVFRPREEIILVPVETN